MNRLALAPTTLPDTAPVEYLRAAVAAGYDAVGMRLFRSPGLPFHPVVGNGPLIRQIKAILGGFRAALELGAELGGRYAMVIGDDPKWARMRDNLGRLCEAAAPLGLTIVIEFVPHRILATLPMALQILAETGCPNGAICLDPLHLARSGGRPADLAGLDARFFPYAQLSDGVLGPGEPDLALARQRGVGERRLLGEGTLALPELLAALPPGIPLSVELPMPTGRQATAGEWARIASENARNFLAGLEGSGPG